MIKVKNPAFHVGPFAKRERAGRGAPVVELIAFGLLTCATIACGNTSNAAGDPCTAQTVCCTGSCINDKCGYAL